MVSPNANRVAFGTDAAERPDDAAAAGAGNGRAGENRGSRAPPRPALGRERKRAEDRLLGQQSKRYQSHSSSSKRLPPLRPKVEKSLRSVVRICRTPDSLASQIRAASAKSMSRSAYLRSVSSISG